MKKLSLLFILTLCISILPAIDIDFTGKAGNMKLAPRTDTAVQANSDEKFFGSYDFDLSTNTVINANLSALSSIGRNSILQNYVSTAICLGVDTISFKAGPWFGIANKAGDSAESLTLLVPGIRLGMEAGVPGLISGFVDTVFTFQSKDAAENRIGINTYNFGAKFWVPNVICSVEVEQIKNTISSKLDKHESTSQTDIGLYADVYSKGLPFRVLVSGIYREIEKKYIDETTPITPDSDRIAHVLAGLELTFIVNPKFQFSFGGEAAFYSFYRDKRTESVFKGGFPFSVSLGTTFKIGDD